MSSNIGKQTGYQLAYDCNGLFLAWERCSSTDDNWGPARREEIESDKTFEVVSPVQRNGHHKNYPVQASSGVARNYQWKTADNTQTCDCLHDWHLLCGICHICKQPGIHLFVCSRKRPGQAFGKRQLCTKGRTSLITCTGTVYGALHCTRWSPRRETTIQNSRCEFLGDIWLTMYIQW